MNRIRLAESQLHNVIRRCVNEALNELDWKTYVNASTKQEELDDKELGPVKSLEELVLALNGSRPYPHADRISKFKKTALKRFKEQHPGDFNPSDNFQKIEYYNPDDEQCYYDEEPKLTYQDTTHNIPNYANGEEALNNAFKNDPIGVERILLKVLLILKIIVMVIMNI